MDLWWVGFFIQFLSAMLLLGWLLPSVVTYWLCKNQKPRPPTWGRCSANAIACFLLEMVIGVVWGHITQAELLSILMGLLIAIIAGAVTSKKIMSISFLRAIPISLICLVDMIAIGFYFGSQLVSLVRALS